MSWSASSAPETNPVPSKRPRASVSPVPSGKGKSKAQPGPGDSDVEEKGEDDYDEVEGSIEEAADTIDIMEVDAADSVSKSQAR